MQCHSEGKIHQRSFGGQSINYGKGGVARRFVEIFRIKKQFEIL